MVICKFFMQGNCRYGDNCKFEHPQGGNSGKSLNITKMSSFEH